jgi:hypothetical protein
VKRTAVFVLVFCSGCTDVFLLPSGAGHDLGLGGVGGNAAPDAGDVAGDLAGIVPNDGGIDDRPIVNLPPSCGYLQCTPTANEGVVTIGSGTLSGCHAYDVLTIDKQVRVTEFHACANTINIGGVIEASGAGHPAAAGAGAGISCAGGG